MANFVAVVDPDGDRRRRFVDVVERHISFLPELRTGSTASGDFAAVWAAHPAAPISTSSGPRGAALVFGDAIAGPGPERLDAAGLVAAWNASPPAVPRAFDGFHALLSWDRTGGLTACADILGLYPVVYFASRDVLVVASSVELIRPHPLVSSSLSLQGLVDALVAHAVVEGRTLAPEVSRLAPAHVLRWWPSAATVEVPQDIPGAAREPDAHSFDDQVELLYNVYREVLDRHVPPGSATGLLLSGGLDSRMLAGFLDRSGSDVSALTLGESSDYEARAAARVARALGFAHQRVPLADERFAEWASLQARWELLAGGFSNVHMWGAMVPLRSLPERCVNGYLRGIREFPGGPPRFEDTLSRPRTYGIEPAVLRKLLRPELEQMVDRSIADLRRSWEAHMAAGPDRQWEYLLHHRWRSHPGGVLWRLAFGSWPVVPTLDRRLLDVVASLPAGVLATSRWLEEMLRRHFPALARLPLDRNSHDTIPLEPTVVERLFNPLVVRARKARARLPWKPRERRHFYRLYDIDGPGWRAIRRRAEPLREALHEWFDPDELRRVLPGPEVTIRPAHVIRDTFATKLLLGLMLLHEERAG